MRCLVHAFLILSAVALTGCAGLPPAGCPVGQEPMRTAQLFLGQAGPEISDSAFRAFVDAELTPRFANGLTILEGGRQWLGEENRLIRESSKVVMIVLPNGPEANRKLDEVRKAYKARFRQKSVLVVTQPACVGF